MTCLGRPTLSSPNDSIAVAGFISADDSGHLHPWDTHHWELLGVPRELDAPAKILAPSPDGNLLAWADSARRIHIIPIHDLDLAPKTLDSTDPRWLRDDLFSIRKPFSLSTDRSMEMSGFGKSKAKGMAPPLLLRVPPWSVPSMASGFGFRNRRPSPPVAAAFLVFSDPFLGNGCWPRSLKLPWNRSPRWLFRTMARRWLSLRISAPRWKSAPFPRESPNGSGVRIGPVKPFNLWWGPTTANGSLAPLTRWQPGLAPVTPGKPAPTGRKLWMLFQAGSLFEKEHQPDRPHRPFGATGNPCPRIFYHPSRM